MTNVALAGLTAAGKTTHARRLASDLGYGYVSATDILLEILQVPDPGSDLWFTKLDAITAAREGGAVDAELEARLIDLAWTSDRTVFDSWALAWISPSSMARIWIESDLPSASASAWCPWAASRVRWGSARCCCAPKTTAADRGGRSVVRERPAAPEAVPGGPGSGHPPARAQAFLRARISAVLFSRAIYGMSSA
jgi:hypothetical protein